MSLFRKPKKIQRRVFCADDDDEPEPEEPRPPPPPVISRKDKPAKVTSLLSFADEEEADGEVFKVKKSKQSSRLAKRREKERRRDTENSPYENHDNGEEPPPIPNNHTPEKPKKKVTLEGLILTGREALAADGAGDISGDSGAEEEEVEENHGFHQYRAENVRAALATAPGLIPDAALIHAARKTRQQARELGGDYIQVKPSEAPPGSRLVRDDGSGDDEDEGRIQVRGLDLPSDKPMRGTAAAPTTEELDSEPDEWEEQQVKKAMLPALQDINVDCELNPFAVAPPPPRLEEAPLHLRVLFLNGDRPTTAAQLVTALTERLEELRVERESVASQRAALSDRLLAAQRTRESRAARTPALDAAYRRAQAARGYLTDLVECLDEKMPSLEALEARALALHRRRCDFLTERRRADQSDQAQDAMAPPVRPGALRPPEPLDKVRRTAEREGRRRARRLAREASSAAGAARAHRDGDSSDDELTPAEEQHIMHEKEAIRQLSGALFADALPAWRSVRGVCARLQRWRRREPELYTAAYVAECLPQLLAPYVRHQLILWNPLADEDNDDYERMEWYRCVMMYGVRGGGRPASGSDSDSDLESDSDEGGDSPPRVTEGSVREDPDLLLVPTLLAKVVLPKVTELVEHAWDPFCVRACIRLRQLVVRASAAPGARRALGRLGRAAALRLKAALAADVYLPALPPQMAEGAGAAFWRRCVGGGVRLLRAALALTGPPELLRADPIVIALVNTLCTAAGAAPPTFAAAACAALAETLPRAGPLRGAALQRIAALATLALGRLQADNPLHLKALEQARAIIAEAKGCALE